MVQEARERKFEDFIEFSHSLPLFVRWPGRADVVMFLTENRKNPSIRRRMENGEWRLEIGDGTECLSMTFPLVCDGVQCTE